MAILFYSTVFLVCLCRAFSQTPAEDSQVWTHRAILDREGKVVLFWTPRLNDIIFELHAQTLGWVGLGFSPDGKMPNSDMVTGWIINKEPTLQDRFAKDHGEPIEDTQQDYPLILSYENETHTVFRFQRLYDTCDPNDTKITNSTMIVIYAYSNDDPVNEVIPPHYFVGHRNLILTGMQNVVQGVTSTNSVPFEMRLPNITISKTDTTLCWQKVFKYVPLSSTEVATSIETLWNNNTAPFVDHVWLYKCDNIVDTIMWDQYANDKGSICSSTDAILQYGNCTKMFGTAAAGSLGYSFGNSASYQINHGADGPSYFLVKVAYSDLKLEEDVQDDTGIAISFSTDMIVPSGTLTIGHEVGLSQIVPKDQKAFMTIGHCDGECTKNNFPTEGIYVYEIFLDAKNAGRKVTLRHMRNGVELEPLVKDDSFISISQTYRTIAEPINILPGDNLILECTYDTTNATSSIVGGILPDSEMCRAYLNYFPLVDLQSCASSPPLAKIFQFLNVNQIAIDVANITYNDTYPATLNPKLMDYAKTYNWETKAGEYQDLVKSTYTSVCAKRNNELVISEPKTVPKVEHPFYEISHCDVLIGDNSSAPTGTQTFPSPGTQTFPSPGTQTFPDHGTQTSPDHGTQTFPSPAGPTTGVSSSHDTSDPMQGDGGHNMGEHGTSVATMTPDHMGNDTESNVVEVHGNHSASTQQGGSANSLKHTTSQIVGLIAIVLTVTLFANTKM